MKKILLGALLLVSSNVFSMGPNTTYTEYQNMKNCSYEVSEAKYIPLISLDQPGSLEYIRKINSSVVKIDLSFFEAIATEKEFERGVAILTQKHSITGQSGLEEYLAFGRSNFGYNIKEKDDKLILAGK